MRYGSSIPPLQSDDGAVSDQASKAVLLNNFFDGKQSRDIVGCPAFCHRRPKLCTFAFRSREVRRLLSELDPHSGVDPLEFFPMFFRELAYVLAPKLSMVFRRLFCAGLFPSQTCCDDIVLIPKGVISFLLSGLRPISITPVLPMVYERLVSSRLCAFMETEGVFSMAPVCLS